MSVELGVLLLGFAWAAAIVIWFHPVTKPYAKYALWACVALTALVLGAALLRRRPGTKIDKAVAEGDAIANANTAAFDTIVDEARAGMALADAEIAVRRVEAAQEREVHAARLATVQTIEDSVERRKALIKLVEATRG